MSRPPLAVLVSRFPLVTETFILREIIEIERQGQPVVLVPMIRETPVVVHEAAKPWVERALYTPWMFRVPLRTLPLLLRLVAGTLRRPGTLLRTLALFPKSVWLARELERRGVRHIHAHFATHPTTMALIIAALTKIPFSFTVHAHDIQLDRSLLRWKIRGRRSSIDLGSIALPEDLTPKHGKISDPRRRASSSCPPCPLRPEFSASPRTSRTRDCPRSSKPAACCARKASRSTATSWATARCARSSKPSITTASSRSSDPATRTKSRA
jgi:hypothetical protein